MIKQNKPAVMGALSNESEIIENEACKQYAEYIKAVLSKKRYNHSMAVAQMCLKLAEMHGENPLKAYTAGILHDVRKEADPQLQLEEVLQSDMGVCEVEKSTPQLWHAISGAFFCKSKFGITDLDILAAIRFHTIGRANMSRLEKIVYLGDLVSDDREYTDVEKYRKLAINDLDNAMYQSVKFSINKTIEKQGKIPHYTFEAYNFYINNK